MKNTTRGFASVPVLIIAFLAILITSMGMYLNNSQSTINNLQENTIATTTNEVADWKTYRNEKYGFEFQCPSNWIIDDRGDFNFSMLFLDQNNQYVNLYVNQGEDMEVMKKRDQNFTLSFENKTIHGIEVVDRILRRTDGGSGDRQIAFYKPGENYRVVIQQEVDLIEDGINKYKDSQRAKDFENITNSFKFTQ